MKVIGWDVGGAHLKAALVSDGKLYEVRQLPCPLWQDLSLLQTGVQQLLAAWPGADHHAITMTAELADIFPDRQTGVQTLVQTLAAELAPASVTVFAGRHGLVSPQEVSAPKMAAAVASANWQASAACVASQLSCGILIDIGSTTSDLIAFADRRLTTTAQSDGDRLYTDELVYTGIVRTPVCAVVQYVPFGDRWQGVAAEVFATMADVYRVLGTLPEGADMMPTADGRSKSVIHSTARLARMLGRDAPDADFGQWRSVAAFIARQQLVRIDKALARVVAAYRLAPETPLIGAGSGRFLVRRLATVNSRPYHDFARFCPDSRFASLSADCAPAVALALLAAANTG